MNRVLIALTLFVTAIGGYVYYSSFVQTSPEDLRRASKSCLIFLQEHMEKEDGKILDNWSKDGKLVFEVGLPEGNSGRYAVHLCVVDLDKETLFKPSVFDNSNWR